MKQVKVICQSNGWKFSVHTGRYEEAVILIPTIVYVHFSYLKMIQIEWLEWKISFNWTRQLKFKHGDGNIGQIG